jgi:membrane protein implicated in regulation of membrane protease activity
MKLFKKYVFALKLLGAALLITLALILELGNHTDIIVVFIGSLIIIYSVVRLVPFVRTQKSDLIKTINIIEITIDVMMGIVMIVLEYQLQNGLGDALGYMLGAYLIMRGAIHFYGVSEGKERSDLVLYFFHVAALVVGGYVLFNGNISATLIIHIILAFSVIVGGYLFYDGGKGFKVYRYEKALYNQSIKEEQTVEKELPVVEEEPQEENIVA